MSLKVSFQWGGFGWGLAAGGRESFEAFLLPAQPTPLPTNNSLCEIYFSFCFVFVLLPVFQFEAFSFLLHLHPLSMWFFSSFSFFFFNLGLFPSCPPPLPTTNSLCEMSWNENWHNAIGLSPVGNLWLPKVCRCDGFSDQVQSSLSYLSKNLKLPFV